VLSFHNVEQYKENQTVFDLVLMSIVSTYVGQPLHIHVEGVRGTGKTTIMRTAKHILPKITRIKGCVYNCDPSAPHCPEHKGMTPEEIKELGVEETTMPFLEISHSSKTGTVVGSIDLEKLTDSMYPEARLLPGIVPQAHRGIIFIDEINRLADTSPEITDVLLDVMGNKPGHLQIEEAGLPVVDLPVSLSVWAASNPDEAPGALEWVRRQLSDRFDMVCSIGRPSSVEVLSRILKKNSFYYKSRHKSKVKIDDANYGILTKKITKWGRAYKTAELTDYLRNYISQLYVNYKFESLRAAEAIEQAVLLYSIIKGHDRVLTSDINQIIPMILKHRIGENALNELIRKMEGKDSNSAEGI